MHKITNVDAEEKTGDCSECGPVSLYRKTGNPRPRWMCMNKRRANNRKSKSVHRFGQDTTEIRLIMFNRQGGLCAVCSDKIELWKSHLDHSHETGEIRGLLCNFCNPGLGLFKDDPQRLLAAARYLSLFGEP